MTAKAELAINRLILEIEAFDAAMAQFGDDYTFSNGKRDVEKQVHAQFTELQKRLVIKNDRALTGEFHKLKEKTVSLILNYNLLVDSGLKIRHSSNEHITDKLGAWRLDRLHVDDIQKADERAKWMPWLWRVTRWTLGAIYGVFLYSTIVFLGEWSNVGLDDADFIITIPGKDWFSNH